MHKGYGTKLTKEQRKEDTNLQEPNLLYLM